MGDPNSAISARESAAEQPKRLIDLITNRQLGRPAPTDDDESDEDGRQKKVSGLASRLLKRIPPPPRLPSSSSLSEWGQESGEDRARNFVDLDFALVDDSAQPPAVAAAESLWRQRESIEGGAPKIFSFDAAIRAARERPKARQWAGE